MAHAVADAIAQGRAPPRAGGHGHRQVARLPRPRRACTRSRRGKPAVVATATLALQAQIVDRDMPRLAEAIAPLLGRRPTYAPGQGPAQLPVRPQARGRLPRRRRGRPPVGRRRSTSRRRRLGAEVVRLREWADVTESGDRDELVPGVSERAWRQVSVSAHECLGGKCPMVAECFVERSREAAKDVDVIVTNHSFMAIDAFEGRQMLPEHDVLVVDEAPRAGRPGDLDDHRRDHGRHGQRRCQAGRPAGRRRPRPSTTRPTSSQGGARASCRRGGSPASRTPSSWRSARVRDTTRAVQSELKPQPGEEADGARQVARAADRRGLRERRAHPRAARARRRVGEPRPAPGPGAARCADERRDAGARQGLRRSHRGHDLGDARARRHLRRRRRHARPARRGRPRLARPRRRQPVRLPQAGHRLRRAAPAAARPRRPQRARPSTRSRPSSGRPAAGPWGCSPRCAPRSDATEAMRERFATEATSRSSARARTRSPPWCGSSRATRTPACSARSRCGRASTCPARRASSSSSTASRSRGPTTRWPRRARRPSRGWAATASWRSPPPTPRCGWPRARAGSSAVADDRGVVAFLDSRMMTARYAGFLQRSLPPFWPTTDRERGARRAASASTRPRPSRSRSHEPALRGVTGAVAGTSMGGDGAEHPRPAATTAPSRRPRRPQPRLARRSPRATRGPSRGRRGAARRQSSSGSASRSSPRASSCRRTSSQPACAASASRPPAPPACPSTDSSPRSSPHAGAVTTPWHAVRVTVTPQRTVPPLVLISGPEGVLADRALASILSELRVTAPDLEVVRLQAGTYETGSLAMHASPSLFGGDKSIVVQDLDEAPDELQTDLLAYLAAPRARHHPGGHPQVAGSAARRCSTPSRRVGARVIDCPAVKTDRDKTDFAMHEFRAARRKATPRGRARPRRGRRQGPARARRPPASS